jgi:hypothetical protein
MHGTPNKTARANAQEPQPKNFGAEARLRENELDLARRRRMKKKRPRPSLGLLMLRDLRTFLHDVYDKHGPAMPEGDDGAREHFVVLMHFVARLGDHYALLAERDFWCPWMDDETFTDLVAEIDRKPRRWRADSLACEIGLNYATRTRLRITAIGANDFGKAKRDKRRTKRNNEAKRLRRAEAGAKPHALSASRLKPWLALGISRATYDRRRKMAREENSGTAAYLLRADESSSPSEQGASPPCGDLTRADSGIEADTAPAGLMLHPALNAIDVVVLVTEPSAADDEIQSPASNTDIPDTKREGTRALREVRACVEDKDQAETLALKAASLLIRLPVANAANAHHDHRNGQAARRPDNQQPHHKGQNHMPRIARIQSREEMFAKIKNFYPVIGLDDATNFDALALVLDHGIDFYELFADVLDQRSFAKEGRDVPPLVEFLVSKCWTEAIAA